MEGSRKCTCISYIIDVILFLSVGAALVLVKKFWPRFQRGMFCNDMSLRYPHQKYDTVSDIILILYCFVFTIIIIFIVELIKTGKSKSYPRQNKWRVWCGQCAGTLSTFILGAAFTIIATDIIKYTLGSLRPDFVAVCLVDWAKTECSTAPDSFIEPIPCREEDEELIQDARQSFPSAHASVSAYAMLFLILLLQDRARPKTRFFIPLLQFVSFGAVIFTCASRISDSKHHWPDVVCGAILGAVIAIFMVFCVSDMFERKYQSNQKPTETLLMHRIENNDNEA